MLSLKSGTNACVPNTTKAMIYGILKTFCSRAALTAVAYAHITEKELDGEIMKKAILFEAISPNGVGRCCSRALERAIFGILPEEGEELDSEEFDILTISVENIKQAEAAIASGNESIYKKSLSLVVVSEIEEFLNELDEDEDDDETETVPPGDAGEADTEEDDDNEEDEQEKFLEEWNNLENARACYTPKTPLEKLIAQSLSFL